MSRRSPTSDVLLQVFPLAIRRSILRRAHRAMPANWRVFPLIMVAAPLGVIVLGLAIGDMRWFVVMAGIAFVFGWLFFRMHGRYETVLAASVAEIIQNEVPCPQCGYSLRGLLDGPTIDCPECGMSLALKDEPPGLSKAESDDLSVNPTPGG